MLPLSSAELGHHQLCFSYLSPGLSGKILVAMFQKTKKDKTKKKDS
jgi:hypothetical protein